jgi:HD-GYP domain-containing protein (c-di-GMP phosphodiesterase class II)
LGNKFVRIIIRTGQPGEAPEEEVIVNYDINDYLVKTEATVQRLFTSLYQSFRAYRDIVYIDNNRKGLEKVIKSSSKIFIQGSVKEFFNCILNELMLFRNDNSSFCFRGKECSDGLIYLDSESYGEIIAATGLYEKYLGREISEINEFKDIYNYICKLDNINSMDLTEICGGFLVWIKSKNDNIAFIFINSQIKNYDIELIKIFLLNYSLTLDSYISNQQALKAQIEIINTLGDAIEKRSHETANHVRRVSEISYLVAKKIGLSEEICNVLKVASTMHDVGKIGIPDSILMKPGRLTEEQFEVIKTHAEIGHKIFSNSDLGVLKMAADICLSHHEKYDGTGYPKGLKGDNIPLYVRIVSVVDVFDALTHKRCYKSAWGVEEAVKYINSQSGLQFDPKIVDVFIRSMDDVLRIRNIYLD